MNKFKEFVDPSLECKYPVRELGKVVGIVAKCVEEEPHNRPNIVKSLKEILLPKVIKLKALQLARNSFSCYLMNQ
jgi:hypothetical protein